MINKTENKIGTFLTLTYTSKNEDKMIAEYIAEIQKLYIFRNNLKIVFTDQQLTFIDQLKSDVVGYKNMCEMTY